ncbi:hypothetical protein [Bradyrhizobium sp. UFLA05-112]
MTDSLQSAIQSLVWAIEEIEKTGNKKAEHHARLALKYLQGKVPDERQRLLLNSSPSCRVPLSAMPSIAA